MLGVEFNKVKIVPYSAEWVKFYRQEYEKIQNTENPLATQYPDNRMLYTEGKQPYIKKILKKALLEFEHK